jgi:hypothetical protein
MLESIDGNDDIGLLLGGTGEMASILNPGGERLLPCFRQDTLPDIDANHPSGSPQGHFYGLSSLPATEVNDNPCCAAGKELFAHENSKLGLAFIGTPAAAVRLTGRDLFQNPILKVTQHPSL